MTEWEEDCMQWRGEVIIGWDAHWCADYDGLPIYALDGEYTFCSCEKTWYWELFRKARYLIFIIKEYLFPIKFEL